MAASFVSASSQYLINSTQPIVSTGYPLTVGVWVNPTSFPNDGTVWAISDTGTTNNFIRGYFNTSGIPRLGAAAGGTENISAGSAVTAGTWNFIVYRAISSTNRRIIILHANGTSSENQATTARAPAGLDNLTVGGHKTSAAATDFFNGLVGELWLTNTDIQPDGSVLNTDTLWQLAYNGPFSLAHIAKDIVEYHSFRKDLSSDTFDSENDVLPILGETLGNTGGAIVGPHPPLPYSYIRPGQTMRNLVI